MSAEEIHDFGIEAVASQMKKEGYDIDSINPVLGQHPQIVGRKGNQLAFVSVQTACYPKKGELSSDLHFQMIDHAENHSAIPYFASVGICNSEGKTEEEMGIPVKGAGFYFAFEGLLIIARSDRVKLFRET